MMRTHSPKPQRRGERVLGGEEMTSTLIEHIGKSLKLVHGMCVYFQFRCHSDTWQWAWSCCGSELEQAPRRSREGFTGVGPTESPLELDALAPWRTSGSGWCIHSPGVCSAICPSRASAAHELTRAPCNWGRAGLLVQYEARPRCPGHPSPGHVFKVPAREQKSDAQRRENPVVGREADRSAISVGTRRFVQLAIK